MPYFRHTIISKNQDLSIYGIKNIFENEFYIMLKAIFGKERYPEPIILILNFISNKSIHNKIKSNF